LVHVLAFDARGFNLKNNLWMNRFAVRSAWGRRRLWIPSATYVDLIEELGFDPPHPPRPHWLTGLHFAVRAAPVGTVLIRTDGFSVAKRHRRLNRARMAQVRPFVERWVY
jgi:hypothetical protein